MVQTSPLVEVVSYSSMVQLLDRRGKVVHQREMQVWNLLTKDCMSEESDNEDGTKTRHSPKWRSERRLLLSSCMM